MRKKNIAILTVLSTLAIALSGCSGDKTANPSSTSEQTTGAEANGADSKADASKDSKAGTDEEKNATLTVGIPQDLDGLDPHIVKAAGTREVLFNVYEGLVKPDSEGNINPAVASEYKVSEDGKTYTFTIRDGVKFHNDAVVTADDVVFSLNRYKETGASIFENVKSIEKADDKTVKIELNEANSEFITYMTVAIMPKDYKLADSMPVGTGPYKYVSRSPQENVVLEKFDDYWDADNAAHIGHVVFKIESNPDSVVMDLEGGSIDMFARVTSTQEAQLSKENFETYKGSMNLVQALYLNNESKPFNDVKVRQALCYAVDPSEIMSFVSDGEGYEVGSAMFPAFKKYFMEELNDVYKKDTDKAKKLLKEAGYPNGFSFTITVPSNYTQHVDTAEVIAEELKEIGVTAKIQQVEWNTWLENVYNGRKFESTVVGIDASTLNASSLLARYQSDSSGNFINFKNDDFDKKFKEALATVDDDKQTSAYKECEKILAQQAASVYIQDLPSFVVLNKKFTGYQFYPLYAQDIAKIRLAN